MRIGRIGVEGDGSFELALGQGEIPIVGKRNASEHHVSRRQFFIQRHRFLRRVARGRQNLSRRLIRIADVDVGAGQLGPGYGVLRILRHGLAQ